MANENGTTTIWRVVIGTLLSALVLSVLTGYSSLASDIDKLDNKKAEKGEIQLQMEYLREEIKEVKQDVKDTKVDISYIKDMLINLRLGKVPIEP